MNQQWKKKLTKFLDKFGNRGEQRRARSPRLVVSTVVILIGISLLSLLGLSLLGIAASTQDPASVPAVIASETQATPAIGPRTAGRPSPTPQPQSLSQSPKVDPQQLRQWLQQLPSPRFTLADRRKTRTFLRQTLRSLGWQVTEQPFATGINLIATRATDPANAPTLLLGAHFDTVERSPGADDNGSGVAALLELARLYAPLPTPRSPTPHALRLVFFDREEQGLEGSMAYASRPENLRSLQGAIILEMLGYACHTPGCQRYPQGLSLNPPSDRGNFLGLIGNVENPELLAAFQPASAPNNLPPLFPLSVPLKGILAPDLLRSDHAPFWLQGIGAVMVTDTANFRNPHYHRPSDRPETLDWEFFAGAVQHVVNATKQLSSAHVPG